MNPRDDAPHPDEPDEPTQYTEAQPDGEVQDPEVSEATDE